MAMRLHLMERMTSRTTAALAAFMLLASGAALSGCGGGGGGSTSESAGSSFSATADDPSARLFLQAASQNFAPNYSTNVRAVRRWPTRHLRIFLKPSADGKDRSEVALRACALWQQTTGGFFSFEPATREDAADIVLSFVPTASLEAGLIGQTRVVFTQPDEILTHAEIAVGWEYENDLLTQVAAHELGHALGISGHSPDQTDLMYAQATWTPSITERDMNTLFWGYRDKGRSVAGISLDAAASSPNTSTEIIDCDQH